MALSRAAYRRLPDLYVVGKEIELLDGTVMWLQVLNPFERDEATHDAAVARSRVMLALKESPDSPEIIQFRSMYLEGGREAAEAALMETRKVELFLEVIDEMKADEKWGEKQQLLERHPDLSTVASETEREFLLQLQEDYALELAKRLESAIHVDKEEIESLSDDDLYEKYRDWWIEQRGGVLGMSEYRLTEMWYSCRVCVGTKNEEGVWDHSDCESHKMRVFETKDEVKHLPEGLQQLIIGELATLEMSEREGKS